MKENRADYNGYYKTIVIQRVEHLCKNRWTDQQKQIEARVDPQTKG